MRIDAPEPDETETIAELWVRLARGQRAFGSHLTSETNRTRIEESMAHYVAEGNLLVAREDDSLVGFAMFSIEQRLYVADETRGLVHNVFVVPERRGEGIGSALMERAEAALADQGATVIALEALAENEAARRFYTERGYRPHRIEFEKRAETDNTSR